MQLTEDIILPVGFTAAGLAAGLKKSGKKDLALIVSDRPAAAAGVFTTNQVRSATVRLDALRVKGGRGRAIVVNSGNANACTGPQGMKDARRMVALAAQALKVPASQVYVASTGPIGIPMPMDLVEPAIPRVAGLLSAAGGPDAADAIMTTDTRPKRCTARFQVEGKTVTLTAMAKGAGMIHPNMATMLCFVCTDAAVEPRALQRALKAAADLTFNCISVDGDQSTNDTLLVLANGAAGHRPLKPGHRDWKTFTASLTAVLRNLALKIARDGEGAKKLITVRVRNARTAKQADAAARAVANSLLVKTCWHGDYPNWGRIMDAVGYSPAHVVEEKVDIYYDDRIAVRRGRSAGTPVAELSAIQSQESFMVTLDLHVGKGAAEVYTCDCSEEYVRINVDYVRDMTGRAPT
jgi:glutamate N-acetyltransferase/amino-acid N-acetyltransferase